MFRQPVQCRQKNGILASLWAHRLQCPILSGAFFLPKQPLGRRSKDERLTRKWMRNHQTGMQDPSGKLAIIASDVPNFSSSLVMRTAPTAPMVPLTPPTHSQPCPQVRRDPIPSCSNSLLLTPMLSSENGSKVEAQTLTVVSPPPVANIPNLEEACTAQTPCLSGACVGFCGGLCLIHVKKCQKYRFDFNFDCSFIAFKIHDCEQARKLGLCVQEN